MNKHQITAAVTAVLCLIGSFVFWTTSLNRVVLPAFSYKTTQLLEQIIDDLAAEFFYAGKSVEPVAVITPTSRAEKEGSVDIAQVPTAKPPVASIAASVIPESQLADIPEDDSLENIDDLGSHFAADVQSDAEEIAVTKEPVDIEVSSKQASALHAAASDQVENTPPQPNLLEQWELSRTWGISVPSLNIRAPIYLPSMKYWKKQLWALLEEQMQVGLNHGAVAYPHSAAPGNKGSLIIAGHSSPPNEEAKKSAYGHVFASLPNIAIGQEITILRGSRRITYAVTDKTVVSPSETSILEQNYDESRLKVITCYPVGTTRDRMIISAVKVDK